MLGAMLRRFRATGGLAAWRLPALSTVLALGALGAGEATLAVVAAVAGAALGWLESTVVIEVSAAGLVRGLLVGGRLLGHPRVLSWTSVREIDTAWVDPGSPTALLTDVRAADGGTIRFTTRMGLRAYRELLGLTVERAAAARLSGLTAELMAEPAAPPPVRSALSDRALLVAAGLLAFWAVALPWIFARY
jgi:hypothetical protein